VTPAEIAPQAAAQRRLPSARQLVWLLLNNPEERTANDQELLDILLQEPSIARSYPLAQRFLEIVRQRKLDAFEPWLNDCLASGVRELANFANGLQQDEAAVRAALSLPWSTGQVEGHITRLKLIKRQMYGRAGFELLRQRVLHRT
jgi:transposase